MLLSLCGAITQQSSWTGDRFRYLKEVFSGLQDVKHGEQRLQFDGSWSERDPKLFEFSRQLVLSKNEEWSYERGAGIDASVRA